MNIVNVLNELLIYALESKASDLHLELDSQLCQIKTRINGVLVVSKQIDLESGNQLMNRLKVLSKMDLNKKSIAQDGQFNYEYCGYLTDIRAAWLPTKLGESMTIRLLKKIKDVPVLTELGMQPELEDSLNAVTGQLQGMIVFSGPTGSGKTTSLYSILKSIDFQRYKVITIEDPVEYIIKGMTQIEISSSLGFPEALRAALRHDPDVLLVGEIRDRLTADTAVQAALTGHLVLATIHANSAADVKKRLLSLGVEQFKVEAALKLTVAQRLLKKRCPVCRGQGCPECNTGVLSRMALFEYLDHQKEQQQTFAETFKIMLNKGKIARGEFFEENVYLSN